MSSYSKTLFYCIERKIKSKTWIQNALLLYTAFTFNSSTNTVFFARKFYISYQQMYNLLTGTKSLKPCITLANLLKEES